MDFYERVKQLVKDKKLTLIPFLQSVEINYETYKSAKRLGYYPRADEAYRIAKSLNTSVEFLITGKEPEIDRKSVIKKYLQEQFEELCK